MSANATVSPQAVPNLCKCGHDIQAHSLAIIPNTCSLCIRQAGNLNNHNFTADVEPWPSTAFPQAEPPLYACAGGFGFAITLTAASGNAKGSTTLTFTGAVPLAVQPGWTLTSVPANPANQTTYTVVQVFGGGFITISPALLFNSPGITFLFQGAIGSTMGPGRPPNGQRAG